MTSRIYTKAIAAILLVCVSVPTAFLFYPHEAEADTASCAGVVAGAVASVIGIAAAEKVVGVSVSTASNTAGTVVGAGSSFGTFFKDCVLTPLAIALAKAMLANITNSIVNWINSGFQGNPSFVQNFNGLIEDTTDQVIGDFIGNQLGLGFLCSSFSLQVKIALAQSQLPYNKKSACTLTQITNNVNGFVKGDNTGGWDNWLQVTTVPQNNVYGATVLAQDELTRQIATKLNVQNKDLDWGGGFRSWQSCDSDATVRAALQKKADDQATIDAGDHEGDGSAGATVTDAQVKAADHNCQTQTPGKVVEAQLDTTLGQGVKQLAVANDIDAIVGALTNQLMVQIVNGGKGLLGAGKSSNGSYTSTSYQNALNPTVDPSLNNAINTGIQSSVTDNNIDSLYTPIDVTASSTATTTPSTAGTGAPAADQTLDINATGDGQVVNTSADSTFNFESDVATNYSESGLGVSISLYQGAGTSTPVAFTTVFTGPKVLYGRTDGTDVVYYLGSGQQSVSWTGVSTDNNVPYQFKVSGTAGATSGEYTIVTDVTKNSQVVKEDASTFSIE